MLIPVRCFTCNKELSSKWQPYIAAIHEEKNKINEPVDGILDLKYVDIKSKKTEESIEGKILTEMGLTKYCCRRMMISNVHLISNI